MLNESELRRLRDEAQTRGREAERLRSEADSARDSAREEGVDLVSDRDAYEKVEALYRDADEAADAAGELRDRYSKELERQGDDTRRSVERDSQREAPANETPGSALTRSEAFSAFQTRARLDLGAAAKELGAVEVMGRDGTLSLIQSRAVDADVMVLPGRLPGITTPHPYQPVTLLDLVGSTAMESDALEYVRELAPSENVAEAPYGTEPEPTDDSNLLAESSWSFDEQSIAVKRIGHYTPASEAQIADTPQFRSLVDTRLVAGVRRKLQDLIVNGSVAGGDPFDGIYNASGVLTVDGTDETRHDIAHKALTKVRITAFEEPEIFGFHPEDFEEYVLEKDSNGNYLNGRGDNTPSTVWGKPYVLSASFPKGTPLAGIPSNAALLGVRSGIAVSATDSHKDWFLRGWLAIRAQMRGAFGVVRPLAFVKITNYGVVGV